MIFFLAKTKWSKAKRTESARGPIRKPNYEIPKRHIKHVSSKNIYVIENLLFLFSVTANTQPTNNRHAFFFGFNEGVLIE